MYSSLESHSCIPKQQAKEAVGNRLLTVAQWRNFGRHRGIGQLASVANKMLDLETTNM